MADNDSGSRIKLPDRDERVISRAKLAIEQSQHLRSNARDTIDASKKLASQMRANAEALRESARRIRAKLRSEGPRDAADTSWAVAGRAARDHLDEITNRDITNNEVLGPPNPADKKLR